MVRERYGRCVGRPVGITPVDAALGATEELPDAELPLLAAVWLAQGWQSDPLIELAGMSRDEARLDARRLLQPVLDSLKVGPGLPRSASGSARFAERVGWAVRAMTGPFIPYSAAQKVLELADDEARTFQGMVDLEALASAVQTYEAAAPGNSEPLEEGIRDLLLDLAKRLGVD